GHRIELPTYAFRRDRYWLERSYRADGSAASTGTDGLRHRITWRPVAGLPVEARPPGRWLLVTEAGGDGWDGALTEALTARIGDLVTLPCPAGADRTELVSLLAEFADGTPVSGVVSTLALAGHEDAEHTGTPSGLLATAALVQALGDA